MRPARGAFIVIILALSLVLPAAVGSAQGPGAAAPDRVGGASTALLAVFLDDPARLTQAQQAGLVLYSYQSSSQGDYLLAGVTLDDDGGVPALGFPVRLLDADTAGASYYLVYPQKLTGAVQWADHGQLLLDLEDQALLRTRPGQVEQLVDAGAEIAWVSLEPKPWPAAGAEMAAPLAITPDPAVQAMLDQVSTDTITLYTRQLSGEQSVTVDGSSYTIAQRQTYSGTPIQKAGHFVSEHLASLGLSTEYHVWGSSGTPSTYPNVIGQITGSTNPGNIYIIGAHLDDYPSSGTAPGADDNASGAVATMIAADILSQHQWSCTLRFAFWTGEEQGMLGSAAYATRASNNSENILGYLNMDMIAYNGGAPNEINLYARSSVAGSVTMRDLYADAVTAYGLNLVPVKYTNDSLGDRSDNVSFWNRGYAAILAIEDYYGDFNPRYHTANDRLSYLDMAYYTDFVKASLATFVHLSGCLLLPDFTVTPTPAARDVCAPADASYTVGVGSVAGFSSPVTLSASSLPAGATATFSQNPVTPTGNSTLTIGPTGSAAAGVYTIGVTGVSGSLSHSKNVTLTLSTGTPAVTALTGPADGSTGAAATPTFTWNAVTGATSYVLQVATDPAFGSLVINQSGLTTTSYTPGSALAADTVYYWRVNAVNGCGSQLSPVSAFRTAASGCFTYTSTDVPKTISDLGNAYSTVTVPDTFTITDANVTLGQITHTYDADLDIYIRHPDTTEIMLSTDNGGSGDNYVNTVFDDEAATAVTAGSAPFTGSYRPEGTLSTFDGKQSTGANLWRLRIYDDSSGDTGTLQSWSLTLCGGSPPPAGDYSDLASSYGIAWHTGGGALRLGSLWTADTSFGVGQDDASDDGITLQSDKNWGDGSAAVDVTVTGGNGCLSAWMDKGSDGSFLTSADLVIDRAPVTAGSNVVPVSLGSFTFPGVSSSYNFRFRLTPRDADLGCDGDAYPAGLAADGVTAPLATPGPTNRGNGGEVEDRPIVFGPLAVTLADFRAVQAGDAIVVSWETNSELGNRGFNLWRGASAEGPELKLNETLIPSQSQGNPGGYSYSWEDRRSLVDGATYWYWLEDLNTNGVLTRHEPVSAQYLAPTAVRLGAFAGRTALPAVPLAAVPLAAALATALAAGATAGAAVARRKR